MTSTELALPEPETTTLAQVRNDLAPMVRAIRERILETGDLAAAEELRRQLGAYHRYVSDKDSKRIVDGETRRTEILIGQLLGPGSEVKTGPGRNASLASEALSKDDRHRFRLLAENAKVVEAAITAGVVTRKALLEHISYRPTQPVQLGEGRCTTLVADPPWVEVKSKASAAEWRRTGDLRHGIEQRLLEHYQTVQLISGSSCWLFIYEEDTHWLLSQSLRTLGKPVSVGNDGRGKAITFWNRQQFRLLEQLQAGD